MALSPTKQLDGAGGGAEDDYAEWSLELKSNAFEGAMKEISSGFEGERAAYEREFLTKLRELRRPITKEIIDTVNSGRPAVEVVNDYFDKTIAEVVGFMHGRRQLEDSLQGKLVHATHHVFEAGVDAMLRRDREKKAFLKQSFEARIEESRISSKVELSNVLLATETKAERQIVELKERALRDAEAFNAALRAKEEEMRVVQVQSNSKLAAEKAGAKHYADQLKSDLEATKAQLEMLRKSTANTTSAKSVLESERKALNEEMARLVNVHKEERQRTELQMHKLRTELDEVKGSQAAERKKIKETTEQASKQLEMAHDQLRSMQFELQSMQQKCDVSTVRLAESEGSLKDLYGRYRESQSILSETLSTKEEHERAALVAQDAIIELTREKDELHGKLQDCKEQAAVNEMKLAEVQSELEGVLKAQERNRKKLVDSEMKASLLSTELSTAREKHKDFEKEIVALNEEIEGLKIARDAAALGDSSKASSHLQQVESLQREMEDASAMRELDKQGSEETIAALRGKIAELELQLQSSESRSSVSSVAVTAGHASSHPHLTPPPQLAAAPVAAAIQEVSVVVKRKSHDGPVQSASMLSLSDDGGEGEGEGDSPVELDPRPAQSDAPDTPSETASRSKGKTPETSQRETLLHNSAQSRKSNSPQRGPRDTQPSAAAPAQAGAHAPSAGRHQRSSHAEASHPRGNASEDFRTRSPSRESHRLGTANTVSTLSGLSMSGMSGVDAASAFMNDASKLLFIDSASEVQIPGGAAPSAAADAFKSLGQSLSAYGFDSESAAFISTSLLQQQNAFNIKMAQQRQAFEACIESFKRSAAAQMELQLVQLSKAHENETVNSAKALNDTKKIVVDLKRKLAEQSARISQMETQALQPRGHEMGNLRELEGKLEQAGLQMQAYLNVIEEQRAQISVFLNAFKNVGGASEGEIDLIKGGGKANAGIKELKLVLPSAAKTSGQQNTRNMHATYSVVKRSKSTTPSGFDSQGDAISGLLPSIRQ